jgi:hypothetical protein
LKLTEEECRRMIAAYFNTTRLIHEMINLDAEIRSGLIRLTEPSGHRKDRYSSLSYGLYYIKQMEFDLRTQREEEDDIAILTKYTVI